MKRLAALASLFCLLSTLAFGAELGGGVKIAEKDGKLRVEIDGKLFTEYHYREVPRPFLFPIQWPDGTGLTRNYPIIKDAKDEDTDHIHHRSVWFGHHHVKGGKEGGVHDFWGESPTSGRMAHEKFLEVASGDNTGVIRARNLWTSKAGEVICSDERTVRIHRVADGRMLDHEITIHASHGAIVLGDNKDAGMAIRVAESMRTAPNKFYKDKPTGHMLNSEGVQDKDCWGKRAKWVDYYGPVNGKTFGVAILDHPQNPKHPTWWHARDYGLCSANAFARSQFEKLPDKNAGDIALESGKSITFKFRFIWHTGEAKPEKIEQQWKAYGAGK